tara:strand:- start:9397 stop:10290 length:894 start_codon:yes stop_codon:yes gene_type:complete
VKIGFFGDSFCESYDYWGQLALPWKELDVNGKKKDKKFKGLHAREMRGEDPSTTTYIKKICDHFDADCVHTGVPGGSVWDTIINQFQEHMLTKGLPDVAVFCWTDFSRIYHKEYRGMNYNSVMNIKNSGVPKRVLTAMRMFYEELFDPQKMKHEYMGALHYFDNLIKTFEGSGHGQTKFIHMHNYGMSHNFDDGEPREWRSLHTFPHEWQHGMMIKPPLVNLTVEGHKFQEYSTEVIESYSANHIHGDDKNQRLADAIIRAIEDYDSKKRKEYKYKVRKLRLTKEILEWGRIPLTTI